jgi:methanethiol S-methyltransferase
MRPLTSPVATSHDSSTLVRALQVTGALCFAFSLAMAGKAYVTTFDAVAPAGTPLWGPLVTDVVLFSTFALHHSLLARTRAKHWIHARVGVDAERALYVILASVLFLACTQGWAPLPGTWYALTGPWWWVGTAVQGAGVVVTLLAARTLSLKELMGLSRPRQAAAHDDRPPLETRGLYTVVRHPIYLGWVLLVAGAPLMTSTRLLFAAISVAYLVVAIPFEERSLIESVGEPYRSYRRRVRWKVLPGLY